MSTEDPGSTENPAAAAQSEISMTSARLTARTIELAIRPNEQDLSNEILYEMCRKYPSHKQPDEIYAKLLIIGRVYAASLQRRKLVDDSERGDGFFKKALPRIIRANIDLLFRPIISSPIDVAQTNEYDKASIYEMHHRLTNVFFRLSGQMNRSLASKYLHFHFPNSFYIYDSRASGAVGRMATRSIRRQSRDALDVAYARFVDRCDQLNSNIQNVFGRRLSPRELDKLLLYLS